MAKPLIPAHHIDRVHLISEAAKAYVLAQNEQMEAGSGRAALDASARVCDTWHMLQFVVQGWCNVCDEGTCPLEREVKLEEWERESVGNAHAKSSTASQQRSVTRSTTKPKLSDASKKLIREKAKHTRLKNHDRNTKSPE